MQYIPLCFYMRHKVLQILKAYLCPMVVFSRTFLLIKHPYGCIFGSIHHIQLLYHAAAIHHMLNNVSYLYHCDTFNRWDAWYNNRGVSWKVNLNQSIIYPSFSCLMTIPY